MKDFLNRLHRTASSARLGIILIAVGLGYFFGALVLSGKGAVTVSSQISLWEAGESADILRLMSDNPLALVWLALLIINLGLRIFDGIAGEKEGRSGSFGGMDDDKARQFLKSLDRWDSLEKVRIPAGEFRKTGEGRYVKSNSAFHRSGSALMKIAALLFLLGLFLSFAARESRMIFLGEGQTGHPGEGMRSPYSYTYDLGPPESYDHNFKLEEVKPGMRGTLKGLQRLLLQQKAEASLSYPAADPGSYFKVHSYPPKLFKGAFLHIIYFGLAPRIIIEDAGGEVLYDGIQILKIFAQGGEQTIRIPDGDLELTVRWYPLEGVEAEYIDLRSQSYQIELSEGDRTLFRGSVPRRERIAAGDKTLIIPETRFWVGLGFLKDRGIYLMFASAALFVPGLIWTLLLALFHSERRIYLYIGERESLIGFEGRIDKGCHLRNYSRLLDRIT